MVYNVGLLGKVAHYREGLVPLGCKGRIPLCFYGCTWWKLGGHEVGLLGGLKGTLVANTRTRVRWLFALSRDETTRVGCRLQLEG
jgi:hypothetical protein